MNNDFNANDLTVDKGSVQRNDDGPLGILSQRLNRDTIIQQQKQGLIDVGQDLAKEQKLVENLTREFEKMKSAKDNAFSDTQIKQAVKALEDYNKITDKLKYAITDIMHSYEMGNISQDELNKKTTEYKKLLINAQAAHEDALDVIDIEHNKINDVTDAIKDQRNLRKVIHNEQMKAIDEESKAAAKAFKASGKDIAQAIKKTTTKAKNWVKGIKDTLNIEDLAKKAEMSSAQKLQTQLQQMYGFKRTGFLGLNSDFQKWKTSGKSGVDTAVYSSDDFKKAIETISELNLSAQKAADLMPTIVRGQKLLGMTADEQKQLSVLSNRTGRDMLTYTTNRIAQYMKNDEKLNIKQLNEMISLNASLATRASDFGIDSEEFSESLNNATKAMTDVFGQESGKDNVYRSAMESIMSNYEQAALDYGMSEGDLRKYLNNGGNLFDLNKNSSGAAGTLYKELMYNYDAVMDDWQKYSEKVGDQNLANLVKAQVDAQRKNQDLSSQTKANAATKSDTKALNDIEKKYGDNLSLTQKAYSWFSNWVDNNFDWVTTENFYKNVIASLSVIEAAVTVGQIADKGINIIKALLGKGGGAGSGLGSKLLGSAGTVEAGKSVGGTGILGGLSKLGAHGASLGTASGSATAGSSALVGGIGVLGIGVAGYDFYKGAKEGGIGNGLRYALGGTATKESSDSDKLKAGLGNGLKGAAIGAMIGGPVGAIAGAGIGLIAAGISQSFAKSDKVREKQLEEQRRIAKNTASSAASMEALRQSSYLTGNSYQSSVPRKAIMSDSELQLKGNKKSGSSGGGGGTSFDKDTKSTTKTTSSTKTNTTSKTNKTTPKTNTTTPKDSNGKPMLSYNNKGQTPTLKMNGTFGKIPRNAGGFSISDGDRGSGIQASSNKGSGYPWNVTSGYGWRDGVWHGGVDFGIPLGTKIGAAKAGTVIETGWDKGGGGWHTAIRTDNGLRYSYLHQVEDPASAVGLKVGMKVKKGDLIGYSGTSGMSTGPHLHFQVDKGYSSWNNGLWMFDTDTPFKYITDGLFSASGASYTGSGSDYDDSSSSSSSSKKESESSSNINEILSSTYKVNLSKAYGGTYGVGSGGMSEVVSGLSDIKQTLINLSNRQTQDEKIMNMISRQPRQDPRMS